VPTDPDQSRRHHRPERTAAPGQPAIGSVPNNFDAATATQRVLDLAQTQGFALAGIARAQPSQWREDLLAWLARGEHGAMEYMAQDVALRCDPTGILPNTRAFLVVADQYATRNDPAETPRFGTGRIARYARGRNYHVVMKRRLHAVADALREVYSFAEFRTCVDTAPILERELAVLAGLGWQGKNTMLLHPRLGSYLLLGVVATTLPLLPAQHPTPDSCGTCTRCIDACPTSAITPYHIDARRCISYLTLEDRAIPAVPTDHTQDWLAGCDICQEVCPHNSPRDAAQDVGTPHQSYSARATTMALLDVLGWNESARRSAFASSALKRVTLPMMKRNALLAARHWLLTEPHHPHAPALRERIAQVAEDPAEPLPLRHLAHRLLAESRGPGAGR
jgi:epoxyqueuosine reductase